MSDNSNEDDRRSIQSEASLHCDADTITSEQSVTWVPQGLADAPFQRSSNASARWRRACFPSRLSSTCSHRRLAPSSPPRSWWLSRRPAAILQRLFRSGTWMHFSGGWIGYRRSVTRPATGDDDDPPMSKPGGRRQVLGGQLTSCTAFCVHAHSLSRKAARTRPIMRRPSAARRHARLSPADCCACTPPTVSRRS